MRSPHPTLLGTAVLSVLLAACTAETQDPGAGDVDAGGGQNPDDPDAGATPTGDCPTENFPAVSAHPANGAYDDPSLNVYCTDTHLVVESNGIPAYEFTQITPNPLQSQDYTWEIPRSPQQAAATTTIPLLGEIGIAVNGLPLFGPNEGAFPDPYGDPVYNNIMDECMGHTAMQGVYHYHALVVACLTAATAAGQASPVIGYAFDGFPIYGPMACVDAACTEVVEVESSWEQTGDPTTYAWDNYTFVAKSGARYLDECNGRIGADGSYRYHATSTFPYILGCYRGNATGTGGTDDGGGGDDGGDDNGGPPPCDSEADCEGACPPGSQGCTCDDGPMGMVCVPTCTTADDCPAGGPPGGFTCNEGICVPA